MKQFFIAILAILMLAGLSPAQDIKSISKTDELKTIMDSNKGKVVIINFWATWCKPCVREFPELVKLYNAYKDKGFSLVFISADVPEEIKSKVVPFLNTQGVDFVTYYNGFDKPEDLINYIDKDWQGAIPSTYIYDKDGNIKSSILGAKSYDYFEGEINKYLN
jgi:thiol-disulfide isomerase/thioredoxin